VEVLLQGIVVELLELIGILEVRAERVLAGIVLAEDVCPQLRWPPVDVLGAAASDVGGLAGTPAFSHDEGPRGVLLRGMGGGGEW